MSNYKLMSMEPTPEMVKAARDSYTRFGYMEMAIRMALAAAPDVQGEPVVWGAFHFRGKYKGQLNYFSYFEDQIDDYIAYVHRRDDSITLQKECLYTTPQPTPDVVALVEALEGIMRVEARDRVMPVGAEWDAARAALAAYHKGVQT